MNNDKRSRSIYSLTFLAVSILLVLTFQNYAAAQEMGMSLTVLADAGSSTVSVSGHTARTNNDITIVVMAPNGNIVSVDQVTPDAKGDYKTKIQTNSQLWKQDGTYKITAQQGTSSLHTLSVKIQVIAGMPTPTLITQSTFEGGIDVLGPEMQRGLTLVVNAPPGATTIGISGTTDVRSSDITITVKAPNGNVVTVSQVSPDITGKYSTQIQTNSPLWKQNGLYTIIAQQRELPEYKQSVQVEIVNGAVIPEFGAIAALVLAVAIISIIVVTAKTRLGVIPKY